MKKVWINAIIQKLKIANIEFRLNEYGYPIIKDCTLCYHFFENEGKHYRSLHVENTFWLRSESMRLPSQNGDWFERLIQIVDFAPVGIEYVTDVQMTVFVNFALKTNCKYKIKSTPYIKDVPHAFEVESNAGVTFLVQFEAKKKKAQIFCNGEKLRTFNQDKAFRYLFDENLRFACEDADSQRRDKIKRRDYF